KTTATRKKNRWKGETTEFDWPFTTEEAFDRPIQHVQYSIINGKLICKCGNTLTQWDLATKEKEMEYYAGQPDEVCVITIDSGSTLSAFVTGNDDDDAQTLTVYWIQTRLPMSTIRVKNDADDWIVAMEFIETWDYLLLLTVTKRGKAMIWYPYNLSLEPDKDFRTPHHLYREPPNEGFGTPLDTINLQEHVGLAEWTPKRTFVISGAKIIITTYEYDDYDDVIPKVDDDVIPKVICAVEDRIKDLPKHLFNRSPSATPIRHLSLKEDNSCSGGSETFSLEITDP